MTVQIRLATLADALLVHRIMQAAFAEYIGLLNPPSGANRETVADVKDALAKGGAVLAWDGQTAVGSARFRFEPDHCYVGRVGVLPEYRGRGIGRLLMESVEKIASDKGYDVIHLSVRMSLPQNLNFYEKFGYSIHDIEDHPKGGDQVATLVKYLRVTE